MSALPPETPVYYKQQFRTCGNKTCKKCHIRGERHGPYWYMFWRDATGKLRSRYIGKELVVDTVALPEDAKPEQEPHPPSC